MDYKKQRGPTFEFSYKKDLCRDYSRGSCTRGIQCPYLHGKEGDPCRDFEKGYCARGQFCPFLHSREPQHTTTTTSFTGTYSTHNGSKEAETCRDYSRGFCPRGENCPFAHEKCRDFSRGFCPRGNSCPFYHEQVEVCRDFNRGHCPRKPCPFVHQYVAPPSKTSMNTVDGGHEVCRDFSRGSCPRGQTCPFLHLGPNAEVNGFFKDQEDKGRKRKKLEVCIDFLLQRCQRGANCPFLHVSLLNDQENNNKILKDFPKLGQ
eukprot:TRINITY_DN4085_c0_g1_i1.p1 TRINITY_DN4085_c0_g1~~TRINITY_DN4085_c0_g1_i1.p1  ORF type:complete len:292 (-),score=54.97 TRINITY_DN4085_c0_g1_i1:23-805(-)